ncbi:helix-turn-helix domain-containing protein [Limosilactobacillus balticus]|uniref:helix-turn-helix domain-containing protein n=1 Tax=Limosilactobacillus balticus TaxID=2759747 RepID=UPI00399572E4
MKLSNKQVTAIKRKRGELGLSITDLARQVGLSRRTIYNIFTEDDRTVNPTTYRKLSDWLIDEYATQDLKDSTAVATQDK